MNVKQFYVKNQFIIWEEECLTFQSYDSTIARIFFDTGILYLYKEWNYSKTTMKYLKLFMKEHIWLGKNMFNFDKPFKKEVERCISKKLIINGDKGW